MYYYDWTYILVLIGLGLSLLAQAKVRSTYAKFEKVPSKSGLTAAQAASHILYRAGISNVQVAHVSGSLTDNYNTSTGVLSLSDSTCNSTSIAAIGVAAHECGHAMQYNNGYALAEARNILYPVASFGQTIAWPLILIGFLTNSSWSNLILKIGILGFAAAVAFTLLTLPIEFDASKRAIVTLRESGMMDEEEISGVRTVLTAAALTYVAAAASSVLNLARILLLSRGRRRS